MWAHRLSEPGRFDRHEVNAPRPEELAAGQVLLKFIVGGICGSDIPYFRGAQNRFSAKAPGREPTSSYGLSLHEIVGEVIASRDRSLPVGARVVGWASSGNALAEYVIADGNGLIEYNPRWLPEQAIGLQPLACAIAAMDRLPDVGGARVAVIGLGPIGVLFTHLLKQSGADQVIGVDPVDRSDIAKLYGVDMPVQATSTEWASELGDADRPSVVLEVVGHQPGTLRDAVTALAPGGYVYCFGIPDEPDQPFPVSQFIRKNARLDAGVTTIAERRSALERADRYLAAHPRLAHGYVTHLLPADDPTTAFRTAARPAAGQLKVALS